MQSQNKFSKGQTNLVVGSYLISIAYGYSPLAIGYTVYSLPFGNLRQVASFNSRVHAVAFVKYVLST